MNIKHKNPNFLSGMFKNSVVRQLVMSTLGTTISIILTFGTTSYINKQKDEEARRLVAMTIISDIDQSTKVVKSLMNAEEKGHDVSSCLMNNLDHLESISDDSLFIFFEYIGRSSFNVDQEFKKANENIFNSNQDSWRKLNDRKFLNNVQEIYNARSVLERQMKEWVYFQKPLTEEEEYQLIMNSDALTTREAFLPVCRKLLNSSRVKNYIAHYQMRIKCYRRIMEYLNKNEENKLLMDITEQDLENFVKTTYLEVRPAKDREIAGVWNAVTSDDREQITYEFRKDHTFTTRQTTPWGHSIYTGFIIQQFTMNGTWNAKGDSLILNCDLKSCKVEVDDEGITYTPDMVDEIEQFKNDLIGGKYWPKTIKILEQNNRKAYATNIDKQGTRMELTEPDKAPVHYQKQM